MSLTADADFAETPRAGRRPVERRAARRVTLAVERIAPTEWDGLVAGFDGVVQEQLCAYALTRWPRATPEPVLFRLDGAVVGGALTMVQRLPLGLGALAVCKWGPMLQDARRADAEAVHQAMIDALVNDYATTRRMMLTIVPRAATEGGNRQFEHLLARRFKAGPVVPFPDRYIVRLRLSDEAQRKSFHQKWRYHLNKAEKAGLSFERGGSERLGEFDALYKAMTDRKNFADHSAYQTIPPLFAVASPELRPELFFVRHEGEVVAGAIIFKAGDTAVYLFGATNDRALPLRAGYFLHWHIIRWLRDNTRADWYDLGGTDGFQGLHQFKKGMVGTEGVIAAMPPVASFAAYRLPMLVGSAAFKARELAQEARRRLDKLRGRGAAAERSQAPASADEAS